MIKRDLRTYTGRSIGEIYARFIAVNELDERPAELHGEFLDLGALRQPFLTIAGDDDILAPEMAVHAVSTLLPQSAEVRLRTAPGGHLAVLSGPAAKATTWRELDEFPGVVGHPPDPQARREPTGVGRGGRRITRAAAAPRALSARATGGTGPRGPGGGRSPPGGRARPTTAA